jgi:hypothetical protein
MVDKKNRYVNLGLLLLTVMALVLVPAVSANEGYFSALQSVYGTTGTSCGTCHIDPNGGGTRNAYGTLFENQQTHSADPTAALQAIGAPGGTVTELSIVAPENITQVASGNLTNITIGTANSTGGNGTVNITNNAPTEGFPVGITNVIWTATDSAGKNVSAVQVVTVTEELSNLTITAPSDITRVATGNLTTVADLGVPTIVGGVPPYTTTNDSPIGGNFAVGETIVTWAVNDSVNTVAIATQNVTITEPVSNLTITAPADITMVATGELTNVANLGVPTVAEGVPPYTIRNDAPNGGNFAVGETIVTWTVNDSVNAVAEATQNVTITEAPLNLTIVAPADITRVATGNLTTIADLGTVTIRGGTLPASINNDAPADGFPIGVTNVTWTVTDGTGAVVTSKQIVTISETGTGGRSRFRHRWGNHRRNYQG